MRRCAEPVEHRRGGQGLHADGAGIWEGAVRAAIMSRRVPIGGTPSSDSGGYIVALTASGDAKGRVVSTDLGECVGPAPALAEFSFRGVGSCGSSAERRILDGEIEANWAWSEAVVRGGPGGG